MSAKEVLKSLDGDFIGLHDMLMQISQLEGISYSDAAIVLNSAIHFGDAPASLYTMHLLHRMQKYDSGHGLKVLEGYLTQAAFEGAPDEMSTASTADFQKIGFSRKEIADRLSRYGAYLESTGVETTNQSPLVHPDWKRHFSVRSNLSLGDAACLLANIDPYDREFLTAEDGAEIRRWNATILDAMNTGALAHNYDPFDQSWTIKPDDLCEWCKVYGWHEPFPVVTPIPTTDAGLREALKLSEAERDNWKRKHGALLSEIESAKAEIERLRFRVNDKTDDELNAKSRNKLLEVFGALVKTWMKIPDDQGRINNIADLRRDIEMGGGNVNERTLRNYLSEASKLLN